MPSAWGVEHGIEKRWVGASEKASASYLVARARNPVQTFGVPEKEGRLVKARQASRNAGFFHGARQGKRIARGG
jgi:hypothetical protein